MAGKPNDLDIWGSPTKGKAECFHCGITYDIECSSAPQDYAATYCSRNCYTTDMEDMFVKIEERANAIQPGEQQDTSPAIKPFRMKVRQDEEQ